MKNAYEVGRLSAQLGFVVLTGGRNIGVMEAGLKGAKEAGGLTVGIFPDDDESRMSAYVDIPIVTNMKSGRNYINALSSDVMVVCGMGPGTSSEASLALNIGKKDVVFVAADNVTNEFYKSLSKDRAYFSETASEAVATIEQLIAEKSEGQKAIVR